MSLQTFIEILERAGLDPDRDGVLDALWLASLDRDFGLGSEPSGRAALPETSVGVRVISAGGGGPEASPERSEAAPEAKKPLPPLQRQKYSADGAYLYPKTDISAGDITTPASPIQLGAARSLAERLPLARALRPFRRRWRSTRDVELDEEATATLTAERQAFGAQGLYPVMRPRTERWYEAHLVLEDDPAIELWASPLKEFGQMLRETGVFRLVRIWRLRLDPADPINLSRAQLETPAGALVSCRMLGGNPRHLIFFASHGASVHWIDGVYRRLVAGWVGTCAVLLHLQPRRRWAHSLLGEAQALARAPQPGSPNASLSVDALWWRPGPDPSATGVVRIPAAALSPDALGAWARMQMGLGRGSEAFLIDPTEELTPQDLESRADQGVDLGLALTNLRERSMAAFDLAMMLSSAPFTLPVARLVQEVTQGGSTDFTVLADLMLSGLVTSDQDQDGVVRETTAYEIHKAARPTLQRAMRDADAVSLAHALQDRLSAHLSAIAGRDLTFAALLADPNGVEALPSSTQAFARLGLALLTRPERQSDLGWREVLEALDVALLGRLARWAASSQPRDGLTVGDDLRPLIRDPRLVELADDDEDDEPLLRPEVAESLRDRITARPFLGLRILWVDDNPSNNRGVSAALVEGGAAVPVEALSTEQALTRTDLATFDIILSDMSREGNDEAGYDLLAGLKRLGIETPVIIFAGYTMRQPGTLERIRTAGAYDGTNNADELLGAIQRAAQSVVFVRSQKPEGTELYRVRGRLIALMRARAQTLRARPTATPAEAPRSGPPRSHRTGPASSDCALVIAWDTPTAQESSAESIYAPAAERIARWLQSPEGRRIPPGQISLHTEGEPYLGESVNRYVRELQAMPRPTRGSRTLFLYFAGNAARSLTGAVYLLSEKPGSQGLLKPQSGMLAVSDLVKWAIGSDEFDRVISLVEGPLVPIPLGGLNTASALRDAVDLLRPKTKLATASLQIEYLRPPIPGIQPVKFSGELADHFASVVDNLPNRSRPSTAIQGEILVSRLRDHGLDRSLLKSRIDGAFDLPLIRQARPPRER